MAGAVEGPEGHDEVVTSRTGASRAAVMTAARRLPKPGPFPIFVGLACGVLLAGLFVETGSPTSSAVAGAGSEAAADAFDAGFDGEATAGGGDGGAAASSGSERDGAGSGGATGAGSTASEGGASGTDPGEPGTPGAPGAPGGESGPAVRGVTDDLIRIGIALPDIGAFAVVEEFNLGDTRGHMEAILDGWKREGAVPVHGRDVEFVYREFNIVGDEDIAACNGFVKDDKVFAVVGLRSFNNGADCLADRFDTPVVTLEATSEQRHQRLYPNLFTIQASSERIARNFIHWAEDRGALEGKTIGIYHETDAAATFAAVDSELKRLGHEPAAYATTDSKTGGPQDQVAVQRFQAAQVDLALLLVSALPTASFMEQAEAQRYRPTYLATDYADHTSDAASSVFPAAQYGGTFGTSMTRVGEIRAGNGLSPEGEACVSNYERYSGRQIDRSSPESAELVVMLQGCDEARVLLTGLQQAGRALHRDSWVAGVETITGMPGAHHGVYDFGPGKHHGAEAQRTVQWLAECSCWKALTPFGPLWPR